MLKITYNFVINWYNYKNEPRHLGQGSSVYAQQVGTRKMSGLDRRNIAIWGDIRMLSYGIIAFIARSNADAFG